MEPWQQWWTIAQEAAETARLAQEASSHRSAASRAYYAAYQATTAILLYVKLKPPEQREAWSHEATPPLLPEHLHSVISSRSKCYDLAQRLRELYKLRLTADYVGSLEVTPLAAANAVKDMRYILNTLEAILPKGEPK